MMRVMTDAEAVLWEADPRLAIKVSFGGPDDCWLWNGSPVGNGYAQVQRNGIRRYVHRVVFAIVNGRDPAPGLDVAHLCSDEAKRAGWCLGGPSCLHRRCVNPAHLQEMTRAENLAAARCGQ